MYDDYDDDSPMSILHRRKSCPCCRAVVHARPVPVFIVKSIAVSISKTRDSAVASGSGSSSPPASPSDDEDPWKGLFPPVEEDDHLYAGDDYEDSEESRGDGSHDEDEDDDDEEGFDDWATNVFGYGSASDAEPYTGEYVPTQWEPPSVFVEFDDYRFGNAEELSMLRRGATPAMVHRYAMRYSHATGLVAVVGGASAPGGRNRVFLGWNISLSAHDAAGAEFMDWVLVDVAERPERWDVRVREAGRGDVDDAVQGSGWDARKLVRDDEVEEYDTTDSEAWIGDEE